MHQIVPAFGPMQSWCKTTDKHQHNGWLDVSGSCSCMVCSSNLAWHEGFQFKTSRKGTAAARDWGETATVWIEIDKPPSLSLSQSLSLSLQSAPWKPNEGKREMKVFFSCQFLYQHLSVPVFCTPVCVVFSSFVCMFVCARARVSVWSSRLVCSSPL